MNKKFTAHYFPALIKYLEEKKVLTNSEITHILEKYNEEGKKHLSFLDEAKRTKVEKALEQNRQRFLEQNNFSRDN